MSESAVQGSTYTGAVKKSADVDTETLNGARDTRIQVLVGPTDGAPNFVMRRILMDEVGSGCGAHVRSGALVFLLASPSGHSPHVARLEAGSGYGL